MLFFVILIAKSNTPAFGSL